MWGFARRLDAYLRFVAEQNQVAQLHHSSLSGCQILVDVDNVGFCWP